MSDINPSLVSSELTTIETFKDTTEKRGSKLTLNELNYISDKQLHQKTDGGGSGEDLFPEYPVIIELDVRDASGPGDISNIHARYLKGGYSEIRECPIDEGNFIALRKLLFAGDVPPEVSDIFVIDENGVLYSGFGNNINMLFNPDGTITFQVVQGDNNQ